MRCLCLSFVIGVCVLLMCPGCATSPPGAGFAHETSDLTPDPEAAFGVLPNGMRYVFYPNREPQGRLFAYLRVAAGSAYEKEAHRGIAHFLEHMAFNGSEHFAPGELVKYFQNIGMRFGGDVNAFTSLDQMAYSLDLPDTREKTIGEAFKLLGDYARRLLLLQSEIDRERGVILAERGDRDSVSWRTHKAKARFMFQDARLSHRMPIGTEASVSALMKPDFDDFYNTWYRPERMTLVVVGDTTFEALKPQIEAAFAGLTAGAPAAEVPGFGTFDHDGVAAFSYSDEEAKNTDVSIGVTTREDRPADTVAQRRYRLARDMAERIVSRRLQRLAKQEGAVFSSANLYSYSAYGWARHAGISVQGEPEDWQKMLKVADRALRRALTFGFTGAEIEQEKARVLQSMDVAVMKASTRNSRGLARAIMRSVGNERVFVSPESRRELMKDYAAGLDNAVLLQAFRKAWKADHRLLTVTGNAEAAEKEILSVYAESVAQGVQPPVEKAKDDFAYADVAAPAGKMVSRKTIDDLDLVQVDFENGLRLNMRKTDFKKNEIRVKLLFGAGSRALSAEQEGLAALANMIMIEGGLGQHSSEDLKSILAGRTAGVGFSVGQRHLTFSGGTIPDDLELTLQLMRAYYTDPGYRPEAVRLARKYYADQYRAMKRKAGGIWGLKVPVLLASGDRRFGRADVETFNSRTVDEVRAWVREQQQMTPLELSIVGDIDVDRCIALVARYFGSLPKVNGEMPAIAPVAFASPGSHRFKVETKIDRGVLSLCWETTDAFSDIHETRRLGMLGRVMSEYLREEVREKIGGAYSPWAGSRMNDTYKGFGYMISMVKVDPDDADKIRDAVLSIAERLYQSGTTAALFKRVLTPTQQSIKKYRRSNGYWMNVVSGSRARPEQIAWARSFVQDYEKMTVEAVNALAKKYLDPAKAVVVVVDPAETGVAADK